MGAFIVLEGPEGGGKTSQARVLSARLADSGYPTILTREPGGTALGTALRQILLPTGPLSISPRSEVLLYNAARAQLVSEVVRPALEQGQVVVSDRYGFSTIAYQGHGRGLEVAEILALVRFATEDLEPDLCLLLDVDPRMGLKRKHGAFLAGGTEEWNRFEQEELAFHQRVREGYLAVAKADPARWLILDSSLPFDTVQDRIVKEVTILLDRRRVQRRPG